MSAPSLSKLRALLARVEARRDAPRLRVLADVAAPAAIAPTLVAPVAPAATAPTLVAPVAPAAFAPPPVAPVTPAPVAPAAFAPPPVAPAPVAPAAFAPPPVAPAPDAPAAFAPSPAEPVRAAATAIAPPPAAPIPHRAPELHIPTSDPEAFGSSNFDADIDDGAVVLPLMFERDLRSKAPEPRLSLPVRPSMPSPEFTPDALPFTLLSDRPPALPTDENALELAAIALSTSMPPVDFGSRGGAVRVEMQTQEIAISGEQHLGHAPPAPEAMAVPQRAGLGSHADLRASVPLPVSSVARGTARVDVPDVVAAKVPELHGPAMTITGTLPQEGPRSFGELLTRSLALRPTPPARPAPSIPPPYDAP